MATPIQGQHEYDIHTDDSKVHTIRTSKSHEHDDFKGSVVEWFNKHAKAFLVTGAGIILIKKGNITLWKK